MDQQSSEPTTISKDDYDSDGSVVLKLEPLNDFSEMDVTDDSGVINIAPIIDNKTEICKIEEIYSIKKEPHEKWFELSENYQPAVESNIDFHVCDGNQNLMLAYRDVSLKTESIQTDDSSSQLVEVSGVIDCNEGVRKNGSPSICVGRLNQSDEKLSDAAPQQQPCHLQSTDEIKRKGM